MREYAFQSEGKGGYQLLGYGALKFLRPQVDRLRKAYSCQKLLRLKVQKADQTRLQLRLPVSRCKDEQQLLGRGIRMFNTIGDR